MRVGREVEFDHSEQLYDWVTNTDTGIMGCEISSVPDECISFAMSQYERFNIPVPVEIQEVVQSGVFAAFYYADTIDPYCLFWNVSEVIMTDEWANYAYEVADPYFPDGSAREISPESLETYRLRTDDYSLVFNECMSKPGLKSLPNGIGDCISDLLAGEYNNEDYIDALSANAELALKEPCRNQDGSINQVKMLAYFELAAWAGFLWLAGPLGQGYRVQHHEIFDLCYQYGEAILVEGVVIAPTHYRRLRRPPKSCYKCGLDAWCVETTQVMTSVHYICEACLNGSMPSLNDAFCGTKFCKHIECPNHKLNFMKGSAGISNVMKHHGQLSASAQSSLRGQRLLG